MDVGRRACKLENATGEDRHFYLKLAVVAICWAAAVALELFD
jgi:hypothetical protein